MNNIVPAIYFIILSLLFSVCGSQERQRYIVLMESLPHGDYSPSEHHAKIIREIVDPSFAGKSLQRSFGRSFHGFAAYLNEAEMQKLKRLPRVESVFLCQKLYPQTTRSMDYMQLADGIARHPGVASDITIGVIDSGIWPESPSFNDQGFGPVPAKWKGECKGGIDFTCNKKIIGARCYSIDDPSSISARDRTGHGTHVASIVAGNYVKGASFYGIAGGVAKGGVPSARLAVYKVCDIYCHTTDLLSAFDDAIADGVDVLSISIASDHAVDFTEDPIAIGSLHAVRRNILTSAAAGNEGPDLGSIQNTAPWMLTAGASTIDRRIMAKVLVGKDTIVLGQGVNAFPSSYRESPLVRGKEVTSTCSETDARNCNPECLDSSLVEQKPDVTAPGVEILAAYSPTASPSHTPMDNRSVQFNILSGSSMATPHVTAAAAYVKSFHPSWSPSAIKSALMTTAWKFFDGLHPEAEFAFGSGHINALSATDPGLVYETRVEEYGNGSCPNDREINYPSMAALVDTQSFVVSIPRTVTNVGEANSTYVAVIDGELSDMRISVEPSTLQFKALNEKLSFVVTVRGKRMKPMTTRRASLVWTDGVHKVHSPLVLYSRNTTSGGEKALTPGLSTTLLLVVIIMAHL